MLEQSTTLMKLSADKDVNVCLYSICGDGESEVALERWWSCAKEADNVLCLFTGSDQKIYDKLLEFAEKDPIDHLKVFYDPMAVFRFDHARNKSIELAEESFPDTDLFFTIDIDEWMKDGWSDLLRGRWLTGIHERVSYSHRHFQVAKPASRNWGHARGWRWKYPCHEVMVRGMEGEIWYQQDECLNLDDELEVVHYRDPEKPRSSYLGLLEIRWSEYRDDQSIAYLVREYLYAGGDRNWNRIIELEPDVERYCVNEGTESCMAYTILGCAYEHFKRDEETERCYEKAVELGPTLRRGYMEYGRWLIEHKRYEDAYHILKKGLDKTVFSRHGIFVDASDMWTWHYLDWLCVASYWSDRPVEALKYSAMALAEEPDNEHVWRNVRQSYLLLEESRR